MNTQKLLQNSNFRNNQNYVLDNDREMIIINNYWQFFSNEQNLWGIIFLISVWWSIIIYTFTESIKIKLNNYYIFFIVLALIIIYFIIKPKYYYSAYIKNIKATNKLIWRDNLKIIDFINPFENKKSSSLLDYDINHINKAFIISYNKKNSLFISFLKILMKLIAKILLLFIKKSK